MKKIISNNIKRKSMGLFTLVCSVVFFMISSAAHASVVGVSSTVKPQGGGLSRGLIGHWSFDGRDISNGRLNDLSGNGNHGNINNISTSTFYVPGKIGQAGKFDGTNDVVVTSGIFPSTPTAFTISGWINIEDYTNGMAAFGKFNGSTGFNMRIVNNAGERRVRCVINNSTVHYPFNLKNNQWYFAACVWDGSNLSVYFNGNNVNTVSVSTLTNSVAEFQIGAVFNFDRFDGKIDDVRVYNRALSGTEIQQLYVMNQSRIGSSVTQNSNNCTVEAMSCGLLGHWTFDGKDITNGRLNDVSGNGNHGSPVSIATTTFYRPGKIGQGTNFDGANDRIDTSSDFIGTGNVTVSAWINPRSYGEGNLGRIITNGNFFLRLNNNASGRVQVSSNNSSTASSAAGSIPMNGFNKWYHVLATRDSSGTANIYINGVLSGTADQSSGTPAAGSTNVIIGNNSAGGATFDGLLDDVKVYNRILTPAEITKVYNDGASSKQAVSVPVNSTNCVSGLSCGLMAYWTFDGKDIVNGRVNDMSGNGKYGNLINISTSTFYTAGKIGQGFNFDGADDMIDTGSDFIGTGERTFSAWIKPKSRGEGGLGRIISNGTLYWRINSDNRMQFTSDGSTVADSGVSSFTTSMHNKWSHVLVTRSASGSTNFYVNGAFVGLANRDSGTPAAGSGNVIIGNNSAGGATFDGGIDQVRIYNRVLSASEISQLYNEGK